VQAPLFATLYAERANGLHRLGRHEEALRDCSRAIYTKDDCRSAWLTKRLALHALGRHEEALREMATLMQGWGQSDSTVRHAHQQAEFEMRKSKRPDYYALMVPWLFTQITLWSRLCWYPVSQPQCVMCRSDDSLCHFVLSNTQGCKRVASEREIKAA
jgi:tetratricopeptide (TPR) repeat protein